MHKYDNIMARINSSKVLLGIILIAGFILRSYGNNFGLPLPIYYDEFHYIISPAIHIIKTGDLNPHYLPWGSLLIYLDVAIFKLMITLDRLGMIKIDMPILILITRFISAIFGTLTLLIVYNIGKVLYNMRVGLVAMIFLMVSPLSVEHSHYGTTDIPATFFLVLYFLFASLILKSGEKKYYILAGISLGFAVSTKYPSAAMFFPLLISHMLWTYKPRQIYDKSMIKKSILNKYLTLSILLSGLAFLLMTPYAILDHKLFIYWLTNHYNKGLGIPSSFIDYLNWLTTGLAGYLEILVVLCIVYIILNVLINPLTLSNLKPDILLMSGIIPFFIFISLLGDKTPRNLIPLLPFFALLVSRVVIDIVEKVSDKIGNKKNDTIRISLIYLISILIIIIPSYDSSVVIKNMERNDTRVLALDWIINNIPEHSKIAFEYEMFTMRVDLIENLTYILMSSGNIDAYDLDYLLKYKVNYIILSDFNKGRCQDPNSKEFKFYESVEKYCELVKTVENSGLSGSRIRIFKIRDVPLPLENTGRLQIIGGLYGFDKNSGLKF